MCLRAATLVPRFEKGGASASGAGVRQYPGSLVDGGQRAGRKAGQEDVRYAGNRHGMADLETAEPQGFWQHQRSV
jgi:hypothetical protein